MNTLGAAYYRKVVESRFSDEHQVAERLLMLEHVDWSCYEESKTHQNVLLAFSNQALYFLRRPDAL